MPSRFDNGAINLNDTGGMPSPPNNSQEIKIYNRNGKLYKVDFSGKETPLSEQELKIYHTEVIEEADATEFTFRVPNPAKPIADLRKLVDGLHTISMNRIENVYDEFTRIMATIRKESVEGDKEIEQEIENLRAVITSVFEDVNTKVNTDLFDLTIQGINKDIDSLAISIMESMSLKANRSELEALGDDLRNSIKKDEVIDCGVVV